MNSISINSLLSLLENAPINIIDIRSNIEYQQGRIPTAKNINRILLSQNPEKYLNKTETYYIYCQAGHFSNTLVEQLKNKGYNTINIIGGYNNYLLRK